MGRPMARNESTLLVLGGVGGTAAESPDIFQRKGRDKGARATKVFQEK